MHFRELLEERDAIRVSYTTLCRMLKAAGISSKRKHRGGGKRRSRFGELLQTDAMSFDRFGCGERFAFQNFTFQIVTDKPVAKKKIQFLFSERIGFKVYYDKRYYPVGESMNQEKEAALWPLVLSELDPGGGKDQVPDLMGIAAVASFRAFTQGLLHSSLEEPFRILGFSAPESNNTTEFAAFIFKFLEEGGKRNNGKWLRFGKGRGLFGRY